MKLKEKTLNNNLEALDQVYDKLAIKIRESEKEEWVEVIQSENGMPNILIKYGARTTHAYDIKNPRKEASGSLSNYPLDRQSITIIVGAGLGFSAKTILSRMEDGHHLIIFDPMAYMLKLFLSHYNYQKELLNGSMIICASKHDFLYIMGTLESAKVISNYTVIVEKYSSVRPEYKEIIDFTTNIINQTRSNVGTVISAGSEIASNDIKSFPYLIRHRGILELKDIFRGKPAVIVGTGPSLSKVLHILKEKQDEVVIICVAQAIRILLAYDIKPDFAGTVDYGKTNLGHYIGIMDCGIPLLCLNRTYWEVAKKYTSPKICVGTWVNDAKDQSIFKMMENKGLLECGGSVSHECMSAAIHMGCDPVILTGMDLSLTDTSHFGQVDESGNVKINENGIIEWHVTDHRSHLKKDIGNFYSMGPAIYIDGYFGGKVLTNTGLLSFRTSFENLAEKYSSEELGQKTIINSTQGGAKIKGVKQLTLKDALSEHTNGKIDKSIIERYKTLSPQADELIEQAIVLMKEDIKTLNKIHKNTVFGLKSNEKINKYKDDKEKLIQFIKLNEKFSHIAEEESKKFPLMGLFIYKESREIQQKEFDIKKTEDKNYLLKEKGRDDLITRIDRNIHILKSAKKASKEIEKLYKESLSLLEKYLETKDESLLIETEPETIDLSDAEKYFERGNFAHPLLDARKILYKKYLPSEKDILQIGIDVKKEDIDRASMIEKKALEMRKEAIQKAIDMEEEDPAKLIRFNELIIESREIGKKEIKDGNYDFKKALPSIKEAFELFPDKEEAIWGLATTYHYCNMHVPAIQMYKRLIEKFPDNYIYQYELGIIEIKGGKFKDGMKRIGELMEKTDQFHHFLINIGDLYYEAKMYNEAIKAYSEYLAKYFSDFNGWLKKARCLKEIGNIKGQKECLRIAKKINPKIQVPK